MLDITGDSLKKIPNLPLLYFFLLTKDVDCSWTNKCELSFAYLKQKLSTTPIFRGPNSALPFHISLDASDTAIGAVLGK
jgi:hypothetical protein